MGNYRLAALAKSQKYSAKQPIVQAIEQFPEGKYLEYPTWLELGSRCFVNES